MTGERSTPPETISARETEQAPQPTIRLEFFRHSIKADKKEGETDYDILLTPEGRVAAQATGANKNPQPEVAVAYGSRRNRALETAHHQMFASTEEIPPEMALSEIEKTVEKYLEEQGLRGQKKGGKRKALDFSFDGSPAFKKEGYDRFLKSKDCMNFLRNDSDHIIRENQDHESTSYSRAAGNVADLVYGYLRALENWERIAKKEPKKYEKFHNELQRFMGSHQTVTECFLMKAIEKAEEAKAEREGHNPKEAAEKAIHEFIASLPSTNGFDVNQGFSVVLGKNKTGTEEIRVRFNDNQWNLTKEQLLEIIKEKDDLEREVRV